MPAQTTLLISVLTLLLAATLLILVQNRKIKILKRKNIHLEYVSSKNFETVTKARDIVRKNELKVRVPHYISEIPKFEPANQNAAIYQAPYKYLHLPGGLILSEREREIIRSSISPSSPDEIAKNETPTAIRTHLERLENSGLLERLSDGRYVATHEGHIHGVMTIAEASVFSHISSKESKSMTIMRLPGDTARRHGEIRAALDSLCSKGYLTRHGNNYILVPMPVSELSVA